MGIEISPERDWRLLDYISYAVPGVNIFNHAHKYATSLNKKRLSYFMDIAAISVYNDMVLTFLESFLE